MESQTEYNLQHLIKISFRIPSENWNYKYIPERKTWWGKVIPAHYYSFMEKDKTAEEMEAMGYMVINNKICSPYKIILYFSNDHKREFSFKEESEALNKRKEIIVMCNSQGISPRLL